MKTAVSIWQGRVSPVFDVSKEVLLLTIQNGKVATRSIESLESTNSKDRTARLIALEVEILICGAISDPLQRELSANGINVIGFVAGDIDSVIATYLDGALPAPAFSMPGCSARHNRHRGKGTCGGQRGRRSRESTVNIVGKEGNHAKKKWNRTNG